ncbi:hypothetical protein Q4505_14955, partial [Pacificibacter sp. 1_MG-2023]|nr:hypothetical protein [Pacificibacter sp. 1_MG-2023]
MGQNTDFVGLDVGKFEIFVYVSKTGAAFSVSNTPAGHSSLQRKLGPVDGQIIALEPTGGYEWTVWKALDAAGYDVRQVCAAHVRAFSHVVLPGFSSGLFRAMFAMKEIWNGKEI